MYYKFKKKKKKVGSISKTRNSFEKFKIQQNLPSGPEILS